MPIINYEDYYKPSKPQPKAPTKYYQPPKPKATAPPKRINTTSPGSGKPNVLVNDGGGQGAWWNAPNETVTQAPIPEYLQGISNWNQTYYSNNPSPFPKIFPDLGKSISQTMAEQYPPIPPRQSYYDVPVYENGMTSWKRVQNVYGSNTRRGGAAPAIPNVFTPWISNVAPTRMGGTSGGYTDTGGAGGSPQAYAPPFAGVPANWNKPAGKSYKRETLAELLARGAVDPWASDPYEIGGAGTDWGSETQEPVYEDDGGGYGWGGGWGGGGGGSASYGASSGVNSYLPGTRAGYGASASSPRYNGYGGARASSYAGAQSANQASWRMPMLVWNI